MKRICLGSFFSLMLLSSACRHTENTASASKSDASDSGTSKTQVAAVGIGDIFRYNYGPRNTGFPKPAVRAAFRRTIGCAKAHFKVAEGLKDAYAQGLFTSPGEKQAWVRVGMDRTDPKGIDDFDKATIAVSMKLMPGPLGDTPPNAPVEGEHDFILQNHHVFFVDTASEFLIAFGDPSIFNPRPKNRLATFLGKT